MTKKLYGGKNCARQTRKKPIAVLLQLDLFGAEPQVITSVYDKDRKASCLQQKKIKTP